jgi:hypothetical protein
MMRSALYKTNTLSWIFIVFAHWNNSTRVDMSLHFDILSWFRAIQSLFFLLNAEDTKGVIRSRKSKDRQHNDQNRKETKRPWSTKHYKEEFYFYVIEIYLFCTLATFFLQKTFNMTMRFCMVTVIIYKLLRWKTFSNCTLKLVLFMTKGR